MNTRTLARALTSCAAAALLACGTAYGATITGGVYDTAPFPAGLNPSQTPPGALDGTFTLTGVNTVSLFSGGGASYTVAGFLTSGGGTATFSNTTVGGSTLNNKELQLFGSASLVGGTTYSLTHDDGAFLYIDGMQIGAAGPNMSETETFTVPTTGTYSFDLIYAEVNGAPATLNFNGPLAATPEPSTFMLLGTGLVGAAGAVRRRMRA